MEQEVNENTIRTESSNLLIFKFTELDATFEVDGDFLDMKAKQNLSLQILFEAICQ
jgi:hypothetical protein